VNVVDERVAEFLDELEPELSCRSAVEVER
jgi:hypothetical protein